MHTAWKSQELFICLQKPYFQKDRGTCDLTKCWWHGRNSSTSWKHCSHLLQKLPQVTCGDIAHSKNYSSEGWQSTYKSCHTHTHCKHLNLYESFGHQLQLTHKVPSCIPAKTNVNLLRFIFCFLVPLQVRIYAIKVILLYSSVKKRKGKSWEPRTESEEAPSAACFLCIF